jgi:2-haloacid dehalogenase
MADAAYAGVVFDVYGTLFDLAPLVDAVAPLTGQPDAFAQLWRTKQLEYSFVRAALGHYVDFDQITGDALDYGLATHRLEIAQAERDAVLSAWRGLPLFPEVPAALAVFQDAGLPLTILSNGTLSSLETLLEQAGVRHSFTAVMSSEQVRTFKPDPKIYQWAMGYFDVTPDRLLFVSSNGFDIAGAKHAGFSVARVNRDGRPLDRLGFEPDLTVPDLDQLATMVRSR